MQIPTLMKSYVACQYPLTSGKYIFTEKQLHCFSTTCDYKYVNAGRRKISVPQIFKLFIV